MKQSKDPFEAALEESLPECPIGQEELESGTQSLAAAGRLGEEFETSSRAGAVAGGCRVNRNVAAAAKNKEDDEEEEENMDVSLASKFPSSADPSKMAKMQPCWLTINSLSGHWFASLSECGGSVGFFVMGG